MREEVSIQVCTGRSFGSAAEALAAVRDGLAFLNGVDAADLPAAVQAECLRGLARAESAHTAAHARMLAAFDSGGGYEEDGQGSARVWLRWQTQVTGGAAAGAVGWMRRLAAHPAVARALAEGAVSPSWARQISAWTDQLPEAHRGDADGILLAAAAGGADLADLAGLAEEMRRRAAGPDQERGDRFDERQVRLDVTFGGAGRLDGDLTPACAAALTAVLEALGKKAGPEDVRTAPQRRHDALEEACQRLISAGCLPDVAGQPTLVQLHMTLDQLRDLPGAAGAEAAWLAGRAAGDGQPGWAPSRAAAAAYACDAKIAPVVTGHLDPDSLAALVHAFLAARHPGPGCHRRGCTGQDTSGAAPAPGAHHGHASPGRPATTTARLTGTLLRFAADTLSGPAGLAAHLRTTVPGIQSCGISLPLDTGVPTETVPPHLRRAVIARDRHCTFPGCAQRPAACQVHHLLARSRGGPTALGNLALLCPFHHLIAIHRWGWSLTLHGDGTTTAVSPDGKRTLRSHGPPRAATA